MKFGSCENKKGKNDAPFLILNSIGPINQQNGAKENIGQNVMRSSDEKTASLVFTEESNLRGFRL